MTQEDMIFKHLCDYGHITSWEAIQEYGITRLSAKIYNLRKQGIEILNKNITKKNRYGRYVTFVDYRFPEYKGEENE